MMIHVSLCHHLLSIRMRRRGLICAAISTSFLYTPMSMYYAMMVGTHIFTSNNHGPDKKAGEFRGNIRALFTDRELRFVDMNGLILVLYDTGVSKTCVCGQRGMRNVRWARPSAVGADGQVEIVGEGVLDLWFPACQLHEDGRIAFCNEDDAMTHIPVEETAIIHSSDNSLIVDADMYTAGYDVYTIEETRQRYLQNRRTGHSIPLFCRQGLLVMLVQLDYGTQNKSPPTPAGDCALSFRGNTILQLSFSSRMWINLGLLVVLFNCVLLMNHISRMDLEILLQMDLEFYFKGCVLFRTIVYESY